MACGTAPISAATISVLPLRSGSSGNLTVVRYGGGAILVDAGLPSGRALDQAIAEASLPWAQVDAVLVSHLHSDHVNAHTVARCGEHGIPVYIHEKNRRMFESRIYSRLDERKRGRFQEQGLLRMFDGSGFNIGPVTVNAFQVPHDAVGLTCGFRLAIPSEGGDFRISMATDLGHGGDGLHEDFLDSDLILIEANHDERMLAESPRQDRHRVSGNEGHLSNRQAGLLLVRALQESRRRPAGIVLCHLSNDHNNPHLAMATVREILSDHALDGIRLYVAPSALPLCAAVRV
ncbi:MAG TPA: MBL fold metallo-hydrolase [Candidatus Deferrimicrobiaceae bacterium]|jgi:phosphoribosyl 1,2-cyclic phosphodiesterase